MVIEILRRYYPDFTFLRATNGRDACKIARAELPTITIMDWEMPEMTGIEALSKLKKHDATASLHVIITSSFSSSANVSRALEEGAIDYIRKPIDEIELVARVRSVLMLHTLIDGLNHAKEVAEKERTNYRSLISSIIPESILKKYKDGDIYIPKKYKSSSVIFIDLVDFTRKTNSLSARALIDELTSLFSIFDRISSNYGCIRIKTIGDAYLAVSGIPDETPDSAMNALNACIEIREIIQYRNALAKSEKDRWSIRIGIATGDVVGAIISPEYNLFDIFGDTVNLASRIQHLGNPNEVWICEKTAEKVKNEIQVESMGVYEVKGKGALHLFRVGNIDLNNITEEELMRNRRKIINKYKL